MKVIDKDHDKVLVSLTRKELVILANAINEMQEALEEWEIPTRVGAESAEIEELRRQLSKLLREDQL